METLPRNLEDNKKDRSSVEFILVDFCSNDNIKQWVISNFSNSLQTGYLKFFTVPIFPRWDASVAKNTAHLYASGDIIVNLDADNWTGYQGGRFLLNIFRNSMHPTVVHQFSGVWRDGSFGRIALERKYFKEIGGYNESFEPMGYQDFDLLARLEQYGLCIKKITDQRYNKAIINTKEESIKFCDSNLSWEEMESKNRLMSQLNLKNGKVIANNGFFGIRDGVLIYDSTSGNWEIASPQNM